MCREGTLAPRSAGRGHEGTGARGWTEAEKQRAHTWRGEIPHDGSKATFLLLCRMFQNFPKSFSQESKP